MLVRPRQIQRAPAHAVDFSAGATAAITIPALRIGISTSKGFSVMCWVWPTTQFPNGTQVWMLANSGTTTPTIGMNFASFGMFAGTENNATTANPPINPNGWNLMAVTWTPAGVISMYGISRSAKNFNSATGATTALTVGATTNFYIGNNGTVNAGYPGRFGGFSIYGRVLSQQEIFAHARQRGPVSQDQLLSYVPLRDAGTAGFDEVLNQAWPVSGTISTVTGPGIGQTDVSPAAMFISSAASNAPNDPLFYGTNA